MTEPTSITQLLEETVNQDFDTSNFYCPEESYTVPELIDHIVECHHGYMKKKLPLMREAAEEIRANSKTLDDKLEQLLFYFDQLSSDQLIHINKEEMVLFPYIKSLYNTQGSDPISSVCFGSVKSPISIIEMEHENTHLELNTLRTLANNYSIPDKSSTEIAHFYKDLEILERDLRIHLYKENNLLHPRAIAKEEEVYS